MYCIKENYVVREEVFDFDDTPFKDEFQDKVYAYAKRAVLDPQSMFKVLDVGCGSGFKLMKWFCHCDTLGMDRKETVAWLNVEYRTRKWSLPIVGAAVDFAPDLAIAADVIEHLPDPDKLLDLLEASGARRMVISTPDRDLLKIGTEDGPPKNIHHIREWNSAEFVQYIGTRFEVLNHQVVDGTCQFVDCRPRPVSTNP